MQRRSNTQVITAFILTDNVDISAPFCTSHSFAVVSILPVVTTVLCGLNAKQTCKTSQESLKEVFYSTTNCLFFFLIHWPLTPFPPKLKFKPLFFEEHSRALRAFCPLATILRIWSEQIRTYALSLTVPCSPEIEWSEWHAVSSMTLYSHSSLHHPDQFNINFCVIVYSR